MYQEVTLIHFDDKLSQSLPFTTYILDLTVIKIQKNGQIHPPLINRQGFLRCGPESEAEAGRRDLGVEIDKFLEDEQPREAATGDRSEPSKGIGASQHSALR